ncbi:hypothetical protein SCHPADRAFT_836053 [Schizopora paradoxa]|uniref:Complex 1 LYR protein domain-containing protein n=1 Tax=Schizopora paradoxa TaxID=27342 RepID=A0A0H2RE79_9AGAM|nr:hypothetical protein SCHPADRAFT_836053 [Schizopora paradoxa]
MSPTREAILRLYSSSLRASHSFSSYNFRNYFIRRTKSTFRDMQKEQDSNRLQSMFDEAVKENAVLKRSAIVNQMYGGWRLVVEKQSPTRERSDT